NLSDQVAEVKDRLIQGRLTSVALGRAEIALHASDLISAEADGLVIRVVAGGGRTLRRSFDFPFDGDHRHRSLVRPGLFDRTYEVGCYQNDFVFVLLALFLLFGLLAGAVDRLDLDLFLVVDLRYAAADLHGGIKHIIRVSWRTDHNGNARTSDDRFAIAGGVVTQRPAVLDHGKPLSGRTFIAGLAKDCVGRKTQRK